MEQLQIIYKGNMIKVTPVATANRTQFIVHMAAEDVTIEMLVHDDRSKHWQNTKTGETDVAGELGELIEQAEQH